MRTICLGVMVAVAAGCSSPQEERIAGLEKRITALEGELARVKGAPPVAAVAAKKGMPTASSHTSWKGVAVDGASEKGLKWLVSVQGADGGWGQDGGKESVAREGAALETQGNDVANTALVCLALLRAGHTPREGEYRGPLAKGIEFILSHVEEAKAEGLEVTKRQGTQIQRKLGPYIDTFLGMLVLSEADGQMADAAAQKRLRAALDKCVAKVEKHQMKDGSWNYGGGWAPVIGTSIAARGLYNAQSKGVRVESDSLLRVDEWTKGNFDAGSKSFKSETGAGVELYAAAQALEQASRPAVAAPQAERITPLAALAGDRATASPAAPPAPRPAEAKLGFGFEEAETVKRAATDKLASASFVGGFGSMGGEEFVSYLNISDSLLRSGGKEWADWNGKIKDRLVKLQNQDGTWAGHHCITGRVACTAASVMTLLAERTSPRVE